MEGLHPGQDAVLISASLTSLLGGAGLVGVRVRGHEGASGTVAHVPGCRARGGRQVDDCVPAQEIAVLGTQHRSPTQGDDSLGSGWRVQDGPHSPVLAVAEALLPLGVEDLGDRHAGATADLGVGVSHLDTERLGQEPGLGRLARAGQSHQHQGQLVVAQSDGRNALPGHDRVFLTIEYGADGWPTMRFSVSCTASDHHCVRSAMRARYPSRLRLASVTESPPVLSRRRSARTRAVMA